MVGLQNPELKSNIIYLTILMMGEPIISPPLQTASNPYSREFLS